MVGAVGDDVDGYGLREALGRKGGSDKYISDVQVLPTGKIMFNHNKDMPFFNVNMPAAWVLNY